MDSPEVLEHRWSPGHILGNRTQFYSLQTSYNTSVVGLGLRPPVSEVWIINLFLSIVILGIIWCKQQKIITNVGTDQFIAVFSLILEILGVYWWIVSPVYTLRRQKDQIFSTLCLDKDYFDLWLHLQITNLLSFLVLCLRPSTGECVVVGLCSVRVCWTLWFLYCQVYSVFTYFEL